MKHTKKLLCVLLSLVMIVGIFGAGTMSASAKGKYYEQKSQFNSQNYTCYNFSSDYYVTEKNGKFYVYGSLGGKLKKKISIQCDYSDSFAIKGKYIYYVNYAKHGIYRVSTNGKNRKKLASLPDDNGNFIYDIYLFIAKDKVFYTVTKISYNGKSSAKSLYKVSLNGKGKKKIDSASSDAYSNGDYLYYLKKGKLVRYGIKNGKKKTYSASKSLKNYSIANMQGNSLYLKKTNSSDKTTVYKMSVKDKKVKKIVSFYTDEPIHDLIVYNSKVYLSTGTGAGNGIASVSSKGKLNYKYYDKYDEAGDCLGFYKNYITVNNYTYNSKTYEQIKTKDKKIVKIDK